MVTPDRRAYERSVDPDRDLDLLPDLDALLTPGSGRRLLCRLCSEPITSDVSRIEVDGGHAHRRTNPFGLSFSFWCFEQAPGAVATGEPTREHTWFPSRAWSFVQCRGCQVQLGWMFEGGEPDRFFALICERLEPEEHSPPPM